MSDDDARLAELRREHAWLRVRVRELERLVVSGFCLLVAGAVVTGLLLPFSIETGEDGDRVSTLTLPFRVLADPGEELDGEEIALVVGFLGLLLACALLLLVVLPVIARGALTSGYRRFASVVVALAVVGSGVVVLMSFAFTDDGRVRAGPGGFVLLLGTAASFLLLTARMTGLVDARESAAAPARRYGAGSVRADDHLRRGRDAS
jgi:hypothetical protein